MAKNDKKENPIGLDQNKNLVQKFSNKPDRFIGPQMPGAFIANRDGSFSPDLTDPAMKARHEKNFKREQPKDEPKADIE